MDFITSLVLILNVIAALAVIVLVLMQHGKGADMGAAFGSGSAGSVFGSSGSANFLSRSTAVCAAVFFISSMALVLLTAPKSHKNDLGVMSGAKPAAAASQAAGQKIPD
ncbi:preprotein translocase subunit SecG [Chitinibacter bivalviorum]|uniref:Protein-export membrane protein SecG n=1 Tax=Chitinibacter bivalviorum TaxID=2739434 RepID=A0A7H9BI99_9NEIS|nr:preprotein translocase subunit SecG [Chitinibacter bivalviorum]QLG88357.1 preprotein translocase subunit SecG [Chitinibacter bivalviorum]